ncbi:MAG: hypothetical protein KAS59_00965 [Alphaproteobacteria bacterium]|nr:hypothetical protein [Alphaproteobacteria bacterium]MCK5658521.1 hypothetical protein [Alphaproteobacteria bacterium]
MTKQSILIKSRRLRAIFSSVIRTLTITARGGLATLVGMMLNVRSANLMELAAALLRAIGRAKIF